MLKVLNGRSFGLLVTLLIVLALPRLITEPYGRGILIVCTLNIMLALSLNLVLGVAGQLHLGQSGFYAVGAYVSTILVKTYAVNFWTAGLVATIVAAILGFLLSLFSMRLRGHYLGIASLGFAVVAYQVAVNWESVTEGVRGIYAIMPPPPISFFGLGEYSFNQQINLFYFTSILAIFVYFLIDAIVRSPIGQSLLAIREDEISAASLGIDSRVWKVFAFSTSSAIAGLAGCFYPVFVGTLVPDAFNIVESISMMAMVIVGGLGTMLGPVIGAIVLTILPEFLREFGELRLMVYGISLTVVVLFMPGGIIQALKSLKNLNPMLKPNALKSS